MRRRRTSAATALIALVLLFAFAYYRDTRRAPPPPSSGGVFASDLRQVVRVVDGDTILLDGSERVRLIGVNTPESVDPRRPVERFSREAAAFTRELVEGKRVRLEFDQERRDRYGRTLAYVFLPDGTLVNEVIIREGYGFAYTRFPYKRMEQFRELERRAREQGRGLWSDSHQAR